MEELYNMINNYYNALAVTGYVDRQHINKILTLDFIINILSDPDYLLFTTTEQQGIINKLYTCITENNNLLC